MAFGQKKFNLVSHIRCCHPDELENSKEFEFESEKVRLRIIQSLSEMVTVNGRPLSYLLDSGLQRLLRNDFESLENSGHGIVLNKNLYEIKEYIANIASEVQKSISAEVKNRMISVLLDIGSKNGISILGIGIQFMKCGCMKNVTIGMISLTQDTQRHILLKN